MTFEGYSSSLLEDAHAPYLSGIPLAPHYCWPIWRFGRVLQPLGGVSLEVEVAQAIGALFEPGHPAALRYLKEGVAEVQALAAASGGRLLRDWPSHLRFNSPAFVELEKTWSPDEILVTYSFVPIIRLPRVIVEIGQGSWLVRESLTICGYPAKSKAWLTASLIAYEGRPTDEVPLLRADLNAARRSLSAFAKDSLAALIRYYLKVLNDDTRSLTLETPLHFQELESLAETEIVSLASSVDLQQAFERLEDRGFKQFRSEAADELFPGAREALDFLEWTEESTELPKSGEWEPGRPKILAIYAEQPACGSVRALVIPRIGTTENRTWYAALTELARVPDQPTKLPLSESAGRFLAMEFGRYF